MLTVKVLNILYNEEINDELVVQLEDYSSFKVKESGDVMNEWILNRTKKITVGIIVGDIPCPSGEEQFFSLDVRQTMTDPQLIDEVINKRLLEKKDPQVTLLGQSQLDHSTQ